MNLGRIKKMYFKNIPEQRGQTLLKSKEILNAFEGKNKTNRLRTENYLVLSSKMQQLRCYISM